MSFHDMKELEYILLEDVVLKCSQLKKLLIISKGKIRIVHYEWFTTQKASKLERGAEIQRMKWKGPKGWVT